MLPERFRCYNLSCCRPWTRLEFNMDHLTLPYRSTATIPECFSGPLAVQLKQCSERPLATPLW